MIKFEDENIEKSVVSGVSCIAVPIEICVSEKGTEITTYRGCADISEEFEARFGTDPLAPKALEWLDSRLSAFAENIGYRYFKSENETMLEYAVCEISQLDKTLIIDKCRMISSNDELAVLCAATGCDIEIDGGDDVIFAVVENGKILSFAGVNDLDYEGISLEISVETMPGEMRRGYGAACTVALSEYLLGRGYRVLYKCSAENTASAALAEKCGFKRECIRYSYVCEKI